MAKETKRAEGKSVKLDKEQVQHLDHAHVPVGKKQESAEVSAQWLNFWVRDPYTGETLFFENLSPGTHLLRDEYGNTWLQQIFY